VPHTNERTTSQIGKRYIAAATLRKDVLIIERTAFLVEFFRSHPCADCGETDPIILEFDHLGNKEFAIAAGIRGRSWQAVLDEIAKCDVVCANCHRRRTALRAGFTRVALAQRQDDSYPIGDPGATERESGRPESNRL
jgi:hypothetical protein